MEVLREVTDWECNTPNHTYLVDGLKIVAYQRAGQNDVTVFSIPLRFDRRYRKFVSGNQAPFEHLLNQVPSHVRRVAGSKGNTYLVDDQAGTCTCPSFMFRKKCKHLETK